MKISENQGKLTEFTENHLKSLKYIKHLHYLLENLQNLDKMSPTLHSRLQHGVPDHQAEP